MLIMCASRARSVQLCHVMQWMIVECIPTPPLSLLRVLEATCVIAIMRSYHSDCSHPRLAPLCFFVVIPVRTRLHHSTPCVRSSDSFFVTSALLFPPVVTLKRRRLPLLQSFTLSPPSPFLHVPFLASPLSQVSSAYAPEGKSLASVTIVGTTYDIT